MSRRAVPIALFFISAVLAISSFFLIFKVVPSSLIYFLGAYFLIGAVFYFVFARNRSYLGGVLSEGRQAEEDVNLGQKAIVRSLAIKASLEKKIRNYQELESFSEQLNNEIALEAVCDIITASTSRLFGVCGNVLLYLVGEKSRRPELRSAKLKVAGERIREKTGDLFDLWVLRHDQPLLVEEAGNDFRFDPEKVPRGTKRLVGSLIEVPLHTGSTLLGLLRIEAAAVRVFSGDDLRFLSVIAHIAELAVENAKYVAHAQELSITDGLTGLYLRRYGLDRLREEFLRAAGSRAPVSFLMIDIDLFKDFNDQFGHVSGDVILTKVSFWLRNFFQVPGCLAFRYGGEEFGVLLPMVSKNEAVRLAESFRLFCAQQEVVLRRQRVNVFVSIGVANIPEDAANPEDLLRLADQALLNAKKKGRNRVCFF